MMLNDGSTARVLDDFFQDSGGGGAGGSSSSSASNMNSGGVGLGLGHKPLPRARRVGDKKSYDEKKISKLSLYP